MAFDIFNVFMSGIVALLVSVVSFLVKEKWIDRPKLCYEVGNCSLMNHYFGKPGQGRAFAEIIISLSNIGGGRLGIGKVLLRPKQTKYPLVLDAYRYNTKKKIRSFVLEKNEAITLIFRRPEHPSLQICEEKEIQADIEVYSPDFSTILKAVPITIYVSKLGDDKSQEMK